MKLPVIYIAGPFRGPDSWAIEQNIRRAETLSLEVWRAGMVALCPHMNTRHFQGALPDETWLIGDLEMLRRCDAVLLVDGWLHSAGTQAEIKEAGAHGIPVFSTLEYLVAWRNRRVSPEQLIQFAKVDP